MTRRIASRRPARRRFHALHLDFLFVAAVVALLFAHVTRPDRPAKRPRGPASHFTAVSLVLSSPEPDPLFAPDSVAHGSLGIAGEPAVPPPPDLALAPIPPPPVPPLRAADIRLPDLPASVAKPSFPAAAAPFSETLAPIGPVGDAGHGPGVAEVFLFRDPGASFPVVFVNAPGTPAAEIPDLERRALALDPGLPATSTVVRVEFGPER